MTTEVARIPMRAGLFRLFQRLRERDSERAKNNRFLLQALEEEKRQGQRIGAIARTIALGVIALLLPFINPTVGVLYYEALLVLSVTLGWAQLRYSRVGLSRRELALIFADLAVLTFIGVVPNPFGGWGLPTAYNYRFDTFIYFFVILAVATLAYSWRTVWSIGSWVAIFWLVGMVGVSLLGFEVPALSDATANAFFAYPAIIKELDPNNIEIGVRVQEIVVFLIVSGILALKSWRSNQLLMRQAEIAAERANLSRYFSPNMVDVLASSSHDIGAVRTQEVAVLFSDIVGFTEIAERCTPHKAMELLRRYHSVIEGAIFQNGGTLDKYLGDGVMATFGTPLTGPSDAANALKAACQIVSDVDRCSREGAVQGDPEFRVSVGVHFGPAILGNIGPARRLEFAVVGDTVNVASRLEASTRTLKCRIVASRDLVEKIDASPTNQALLGQFQPKLGVQLRGRAAPIDVWVSF